MQIQANLVEVNDIVLAFAQIGGIVILFVADLGMSFRDFVKGGQRGRGTTGIRARRSGLTAALGTAEKKGKFC